MADRVIEELDEAESLQLISAGGIGRIAYQSRFGPAVLPVNYKRHDGAVVFRTTRHSALDEDLQTGISGGDYLVAFEIDEIDEPGRQGWSVLIQGPAHHVEAEAERQAASGGWPAVRPPCAEILQRQPDAAAMMSFRRCSGGAAGRGPRRTRRRAR